MRSFALLMRLSFQKVVQLMRAVNGKSGSFLSARSQSLERFQGYSCHVRNPEFDRDGGDATCYVPLGFCEESVLY